MKELNHFREYVLPRGIAVYRRERFDFDTQGELLNHPVVQKWAQDLDDIKFYRFSIVKHSLVAEYNEGRDWWIVGYIAYPERLNLPEWNPVN